MPSVHISRDADDPAWDEFLACVPGGHHVQTSAWAQVKACFGWEAMRILVSREGRVVAGAQMLIRSVPLVGAVGHVSKGPACAGSDPELAALVLNELNWFARLRKIRCLVVQPPSDAHALASRLEGWGFWPTSVSVAQATATTLVDLSKDEDALLASMHATTRRNIRRGLAQGITVRSGTEADVLIFCRLLEATGQRQGFRTESEAYISRMYRILAARGWLKLFIAEYQGEAVSAALAICFGDTVIYKRGAWSGRHREHRPNEVMHWEVMRWAKAQGYRYYDFEEIEPAYARAVLAGGPIPDRLNRSLDSFKLGFGGRAVLLPSVYAFVDNALLDSAFRVVVARFSDLLLVRRAINGIRMRNSKSMQPAPQLRARPVTVQ